MRDKRTHLLAVIVGVLVAVPITVAVDSGPDHHRHIVVHVGGQPPTTVAVDGVDADTKPDDTVRLDPQAQAQAAAQPAPDSDLSHSLRAPGDKPAGPSVNYGAAPQAWPGCRTAFVRNESYRTSGIPVQLIVWHYTVSADTPGWSDNDALTSRANDPAAQVSWHFQIGRSDGNCTYNVPISMKAWHAVAANSASVGIEVHATGSEGRYVQGAGERRLIQVTQRIGRLEHIPMQRGAVSCSGGTLHVIRPGIVRHVDLGSCGGGHFDTNPFPDPIAQLLPELQAHRVKVTARDRAACKRSRAYWREPKVRRKHNRRFQRARRARLHAHGLRCSHGRVRRK